jgi:transposase
MVRRRMEKGEVEQTVRLYASGLCMAEVARRLGVSVGAVHYRLMKAGFPRRARRDYAGRGISREQTERMRELYAKGMSLRAVAKETGVSAETVRQRLKAAGVKIRARSEYMHTRLLWDGLERIAQLYLSGLSAAEVGRRMGMRDDRILYRLHKLGIAIRPAGSYSQLAEEEKRRTVDLYMNTMSGVKVAQQIGVSVPTVYSRLRRMGIPRRRRGPHPAGEDAQAPEP